LLTSGAGIAIGFERLLDRFSGIKTFQHTEGIISVFAESGTVNDYDYKNAVFFTNYDI
jgi:hypothetical protein